MTTASMQLFKHVHIYTVNYATYSQNCVTRIILGEVIFVL